MEQQPGPVNWAPHNPAPRKGMVRLWTHEAFAHGAEVVSYFRWRQAPFAQEQMHAGLLRPDSVEAPGHGEAVAVAREIAGLDLAMPERADVAIVFDYPSAWAWAIQPQGRGFDYFRLVHELYRTLRRLGLSVDFVDAKAGGIGDHPLVLVPGLFAWTPALRKALAEAKGQVLVGPRTGSKTDDFAIPAVLPPELPGALEGLKVTRVESLPPNLTVPMEGGEGAFRTWREILDGIGGGKVRRRSEDGEAALVSSGRLHYLAGWPDENLALAVMRDLATAAGLPLLDLPEGLRVRRSGGHIHCFNYGDVPVRLSDHGIAGSPVLGTLDLEPSGVAIVKI